MNHALQQSFAPVNRQSAPGYRELLGEKSWRKLHPAVQRRFSVDAIKTVTYQGEMIDVEMSAAGWLFAQFCRLLGTPLAYKRGNNIPTTVRVYYDKQRQGMYWDRFYRFGKNGLNRVRSTKCITTNIGLVEMVGFGLGMKLNLTESEGALVFASEYYFLKIGRNFFQLPDWLTPGETTVQQKAIDDEWFEFSLVVMHPWLGRVFYQQGIFHVDNK